MRVPALAVVPAVLAAAGGLYLLAKPKQTVDLAALASRLDRLDSAAASGTASAAFLRSASVREADAYDTTVVRQTLAARSLTEEQSAAVVAAAGRRYMRRKQALDDAERTSGAGPAVESLRGEVERARQVCEVAESLGRRTRHPSLIARADLELEWRLSSTAAKTVGLMDRSPGTATFTEKDLAQLERAFQARFGSALPVSARGATSLHRALGFDHRGRFDVAVRPDHPEGLWVRSYLSAKNVPFLAFTGAVPGSATGAHIHIGPASTRLTAAD
jgi:hypothetical protein